jgi:hypothetical protein
VRERLRHVVAKGGWNFLFSEHCCDKHGDNKSDHRPITDNTEYLQGVRSDGTEF